MLELLLANIFKLVAKNVVLNIDTLGTSEEPSSSISAEWPGASDKRAGDKLKTGPSWTEVCRLLLFLILDLFGDRCSLLGNCGNPSVVHNSWWVRRPRLVILKAYWHGPELEDQYNYEVLWIEDTLLLNSRTSACDWLFYLKWVPKSRLGANGWSVTMVVPFPLAHTGMLKVCPSWISSNSSSWKGKVSFKWAINFNCKLCSGGISPSVGSTHQRDLFFTYQQTYTWYSTQKSQKH